MKVRVLVVLGLLTVMAIPAVAQTCNSDQYVNKLLCTIPQLFGVHGLRLPNSHHDAHFADVSESLFATPLNQAIGQELSIIPLGSSRSGTTFILDSEGHPKPVAEDNLGPILTERASVIGRKAISLGFAFQYFDFNRIDGVDLNRYPVVLIHDGSEDLSKLKSPYQNDYVTTSNQIHLELKQTVIYAVFGLTNRLDASIEVPFQAAHLRVASAAHIVRTQPCEKTQNTNPASANYQGGGCSGPILDPENAADCGEFHYFIGGAGDCASAFSSVDEKFPLPGVGFNITLPDGSTFNQPARSGSPAQDATGIGDITLRGKYQVLRGERLAGSVGLGVRLASGDANNFLGTGAYGVIPFGALSYSGRLSPHVRFGYQWNSHSSLAGDPSGVPNSLTSQAAPASASLPPAWLYSGGADFRATRRLTIAADLIGERVLSANRVYLGSYNRLPETDGTTPPSTESTVQVPSIQTRTASYSSDAIAIGGKVRLFKQLVLIGNVTSRIDNGGLRANVVPLGGLSYAF